MAPMPASLPRELERACCDRLEVEGETAPGVGVLSGPWWLSWRNSSA